MSLLTELIKFEHFGGRDGRRYMHILMVDPAKV